MGPLVEEVERGVRGRGIEAEMIVVDDGSSDETRARLGELAASRRWLVVLYWDVPRGKSAAIAAGIRAARGRYVATLDADLQDDPAELPGMLRVLHETGADMVQGDRSANRRDNVFRKLGTWIGREARWWALGDPVRDTGCGARVMRAELARQLPLQFEGMHRFFAAYAQALGAKVVEVPVEHRPRAAGKTKYGLGVFTRGVAGFFDLLAVRWMGKRLRETGVEVWGRGGGGTGGGGDKVKR